jgi:hypothetical protein
MTSSVGTARASRPGPLRTVALAVAAVLALGPAACADGTSDTGDAGGAPGTPTSPGPGATTGPPATPEDRGPQDSDVELFEFEISSGRADPPLARVTVEQGVTVRIVVTADEPDELHLHGYDLDAALEPGREATLEFVADRPGLFELETHHSGLILLQLAVR